MSNPLVNFGDLGPAAKVLVENVSAAIGGLAGPWQTKRMAKAQAEADIIEAEGRMAVLDVERRGLQRMIEEEGIRQANIESIMAKAIPQLSHNSNPDKIENDWLAYFFNKGRIVSDVDMQFIWANILAGEANLPGTFSKRTIDVVASLDKRDAETFTALCGFACEMSGPCPLVYDERHSIYNDRGIDFDKLNHLEHAGLISYDNGVFGLGYSKANDRKTFRIFYHDTYIDAEAGSEVSGFPLGKIIFSRTGEELYRVCNPPYYDDFPQYIVGTLIQKQYVIHSQGTVAMAPPST